MGYQSLTIPCKGGLDLNSTQQELLNRPQEAIQLVNFEPKKSGGYRRISGYGEWGSIPIPGTPSAIKGVFTYRGGVLVAEGTNLWHSFTGSAWTKVNATYAANSSKATVDGSTILPLATVDESTLQFDIYSEGTLDHLYISTGNGAPLYLLIDGVSEGSATYTFREVGLAELGGAKWLTLFQDQVILANTTSKPTSLIYSSFPTTDLTSAEVSAGLTPREKYTGSTSGEISVKRPITGIAEHRETLYIFTDRTISKVNGLRDGNPTVLPVASNIGCVDGNTIQEIGGDLLFLALDGLRTISQTERIDDVELGVISREVAPLTDEIMNDLERITFSSCVIRSKNQYRLWWKDSAAAIETQRGLMVAYSFDSNTGGFQWEFGELKGWEVNAVQGGEDLVGREFFVSGDDTGKVYQFESGINFNGTRIPWLYQMPFIDFGDIGIRKSIHDVRLLLLTEGVVVPGLEIRYDFGNSDSPQPAPYVLNQLEPIATYGSAIYGTDVYGVVSSAEQNVYGEGSGFTVSIRISDTGEDDAPFTINSLQLDYTPSGRI